MTGVCQIDLDEARKGVNGRASPSTLKVRQPRVAEIDQLLTYSRTMEIARAINCVPVDNLHPNR